MAPSAPSPWRSRYATMRESKGAQAALEFVCRLLFLVTMNVTTTTVERVTGVLSSEQKKNLRGLKDNWMELLWGMDFYYMFVYQIMWHDADGHFLELDYWTKRVQDDPKLLEKRLVPFEDVIDVSAVMRDARLRKHFNQILAAACFQIAIFKIGSEASSPGSTTFREWYRNLQEVAKSSGLRINALPLINMHGPTSTNPTADAHMTQADIEDDPTEYGVPENEMADGNINLVPEDTDDPQDINEGLPESRLQAQSAPAPPAPSPSTPTHSIAAPSTPAPVAKRMIESLGLSSSKYDRRLPSRPSTPEQSAPLAPLTPPDSTKRKAHDIIDVDSGSEIEFYEEREIRPTKRRL